MTLCNYMHACRQAHTSKAKAIAARQRGIRLVIKKRISCEMSARTGTRMCNHDPLFRMHACRQAHAPNVKDIAARQRPIPWGAEGGSRSQSSATRFKTRSSRLARCGCPHQALSGLPSTPSSRSKCLKQLQVSCRCSSAGAG